MPYILIGYKCITNTKYVGYADIQDTAMAVASNFLTIKT
jgi:hypothetical protein